MCSVEHIPGPPLLLKSKVFFKMLIAFYLSNEKKGEWGEGVDREEVGEERVNFGRTFVDKNPISNLVHLFNQYDPTLTPIPIPPTPTQTAPANYKIFFILQKKKKKAADWGPRPWYGPWWAR